MHKNRREVVKLLTALGASSVLAKALAHEGHQHMHMQPGMPMPTSLETIAAKPTPWEKGTCDFCGMPLKTPPPGAWKGRTYAPGFFEQTYSQIALKEAEKAHHFESIACMVNYAWVHGLVDGVGSTFYVTDRGAYDPAKGPASVRLIPAREAVYLWGEKKGWVVMNAKIAAFTTPEAAMAFAKNTPDLGRTRVLDWQILRDLAPLPEANLVQLLAKHAGLLK